MLVLPPPSRVPLICSVAGTGYLLYSIRDTNVGDLARMGRFFYLTTHEHQPRYPSIVSDSINQDLADPTLHSILPESRAHRLGLCM